MASDMSAPIPPGGPLEVVFSFDTTGSMYSWLDELRGRIQDMIQRLQADIPGIKIAVLAHGDYCDASVYVTKWIDFTSDVAKLCDFVKNVERTGGGDAPECYELVLRQVGTELSWTPGSRRVLVMIGDNNPHEPNEACNKDKINWKEETEKLALAGVTIYGVQCGRYSNADRFYKTISKATMGKHLRLEDFGSLFDTLMAVCYREGNDTAMLASYEKEVRARCGGKGLAVDIDAIFASLRDDEEDDSGSSSTSGLKTTRPGLKKAKKRSPKKGAASKAAKTPKLKGPKPAMAKRVRRPSKPSIKTGLAKFKQDNLPLLKRENVPETNFGLRSLKWTPWQPTMVSTKEEIPKGGKYLWVKRRNAPGYRAERLHAPKLTSAQAHDQRALFEVAVQGSGTNKRRYVVFSAFSAHCFRNTRWERRLLGIVRTQVDRVLKDGGKVFIRYCLVGPQTAFLSTRKYIQRYDYAWRKLKNVRPSARDVTKGSLNVSVSGI